MVCPRCNAAWDQSKQACTRCGFAVRPQRRTTSAAEPDIRQPPVNRVSESFGPENFPGAEPARRVHSVRPATSGPAGGPRTPIPPAFGEGQAESEAQFRQERPFRVKFYKERVSSEESGTVVQEDPRSTRSTDALTWDASTAPEPPRKPGSATQHIHNRERQRRTQAPHQPEPASEQQGAPRLKPGMLLYSNRYRLSECLAQQTWQAGASETQWLAQDARRGGALVRLAEVVLPERDSALKQSIIRSATMALHAVGRHTHVPTLLDVFNDQERTFFVFEHVEGESLFARMRRLGHFLAEPEVIECCLQVTGVLEFLEQQSPPLVHGLLRPENIIVGRTRSHYILTNFSVILAGGATQFVSGSARSQLSPYAAPEFSHGVIDARSDIYSLIATAYYLLTGSVPVRSNGSIMHARRLNPHISAPFEAILAKGLYSGQGLRPDISQRYQHASELRQALLMQHTVSGTLTPAPPQPPSEERQPPTPPTPPISASENTLRNHPALQSLVANLDLDKEERVLLLPEPENLPPLLESNDYQRALVLLCGLLLCLATVIVVTRGWM
ncbi:MAG: protein kinase [Ktedonobacteraceae bacterium]|nr:protein kinase [Ktedonobacteraceae bacterium]